MSRSSRYLTLLVASGCASAVSVPAQVVHPAAVPVRAFPHILVVAEGQNPGVAQRLAAHLERSRSRVTLVDRDTLEQLRQAGLPPASVVVRVRTRLTRDERATWVRRSPCMGVGCVGMPTTTMSTVPVIRGDLTVSVDDAASGRHLQRAHVDVQRSGYDPAVLRLRVSEALARRMIQMVDPRTERISVALLSVEHPEVQTALHSIREGRWPVGRRRLQQLVQSSSFSRLAPEHRARVYYNLGVALRFDDTIPGGSRFQSAKSALRLAAHLRPEKRYWKALSDLEAHRRRHAVLEETTAAMNHNFALVQNPAMVVPEPPPSYRRRQR